MLRISQIKLPVEDDQTKLENKICETLRISRDRLVSWKIVRRSIEARSHERLAFVYSADVNVKNEGAVLKKNRKNNITAVKPVFYKEPKGGNEELKKRPVVVGSGPAGLFCALLLAKKGYRPVIIERGEQIEKRKKTVESFWKGNELKLNSNVQFGEGGAGAFSDGKLNTGVNDKEGRIAYVLNTFVKYGAKEEITYDAKPHVGTDILYNVVQNMRNDIISMGGEFRFDSCVTDIKTEDDRLKALVINSSEEVKADILALAIGHSARDTVRMLHGHGMKMEPKALAVGVRIQHPQSLINDSQWGENAPKLLGAAPYKLTSKMPDGRGVYTFCMCPGGYVVNASSEINRLAVNGMSYSGRSSGFANSALIVTVTPEDFSDRGTDELPYELKTVAFLQELEEKAFNAAKGRIPVQRFEDFRLGRISENNSFEPCTKGQWEYADVRGIFPDFIAEDLIEGVLDMGQRLKGFDTGDALLMGVESRTSSPVRLLRNEELQCNIKGIYPCGEGAGYAGGIVSAAVDGLKTAEAIIKKYRPFEEN